MKLNRGHRRKRIVNDLAGEGHTIEEEKQSRYFSVDLAAVIWERDSEDESYDARGGEGNEQYLKHTPVEFGVRVPPESRKPAWMWLLCRPPRDAHPACRHFIPTGLFQSFCREKGH